MPFSQRYLEMHTIEMRIGYTFFPTILGNAYYWKSRIGYWEGWVGAEGHASRKDRRHPALYIGYMYHFHLVVSPQLIIRISCAICSFTCALCTSRHHATLTSWIASIRFCTPFKDFGNYRSRFRIRMPTIFIGLNKSFRGALVLLPFAIFLKSLLVKWHPCSVSHSQKVFGHWISARKLRWASKCLTDCVIYSYH